jgi:very-short-patch-repair endonuclease
MKKELITCEWCKKIFEMRHKGQKFCNRSCATSYKNHIRVWKESSKKKISDKAKERDISGENNPFYGKKHKKESLEQMKQNMPDMSGENNPFYGKTHNKETKTYISEVNKELWKDEKWKKEQSKKFSLGQQKLRDKDPKAYSEMKAKAGKISSKKQGKYKKNKLETKFENLLNEANIENEYSIIMENFQYDFKIKNKRLLIEVDGDYWHGNPELYESFNYIQEKNKKRDILKNKFAEEHNFKLIRVWESDVNNKEKMEILINEIQTYTD